MKLELNLHYLPTTGNHYIDEMSHTFHSQGKI